MIAVFDFEQKHMSLLHEMLESQDYMGISDITYETLPQLGFIAIQSSIPVAAGFLRIVEGGYAQIDTLTTNAKFKSKSRHEALSKVVEELIEAAKILELKGILAFTKDEGILKRAESLGFHTVPQTIIALSLTKTHR